MKLENILENFLANIFAAVFVAIVVFFVSCIRNFFLERKLKEAISSNGVGIKYGLNPLVAEFSLQIHNYANAGVRVRGVVLICDKFSVELSPGQTLYQTPLSNEITRERFVRTYLSKDALTLDNNPHAILLPAKTMAIWYAKTDQISTREWLVKKVYVVFEYSTIFGNIAMVRVEAQESAFKLIKENFENLARAAYRKEPMGGVEMLQNKVEYST